MAHQLAADDARQSLTAHVSARGAEIRAKYGPTIGWSQLQEIFADRECVRYPCELVFDAEPLESGECAFPEPCGDNPEDGFRLCIHPYFSTTPARVPLIALYQVVAINYGAFASPDDAECFGAAVLGLEKENYYSALCDMADEISPEGGSAGASEEASHACTCGQDPKESDGCCGNKISLFDNSCTAKAKR